MIESVYFTLYRVLETCFRRRCRSLLRVPELIPARVVVGGSVPQPSQGQPPW